jgi:hypothetical protein
MNIFLFIFGIIIFLVIVPLLTLWGAFCANHFCNNPYKQIVLAFGIGIPVGFILFVGSISLAVYEAQLIFNIH